MLDAVCRYLNRVSKSPGHRLPKSSEAIVPKPLADCFDFFLDLRTPLTFGFVYLFLVFFFNQRRPSQNHLRSKLSTTLVLLHNLGLCIYSCWNFLSLAPVVARVFTRAYSIAGFEGFKHAYCDSDSSIYINYILPYGYLFYLSKYYEVVDSFIILAKGSRVGVLQSYHHFGAILAMWSGIRFEVTPILYFCVANSFVHTIMYAYYSATTLRLPFPRILKKFITSLQICQFFAGEVYGASFFLIKLQKVLVPGMMRAKQACLKNEGARFGALFNMVYVVRHSQGFQ